MILRMETGIPIRYAYQGIGNSFYETETNVWSIIQNGEKINLNA